MRRVNAFLTHQANEWVKRTSARSVESPELNEGLAAYVFHQAHITTELRERLAKQWRNLKDYRQSDGGDKATTREDGR